MQTRSFAEAGSAINKTRKLEALSPSPQKQVHHPVFGTTPSPKSLAPIRIRRQQPSTQLQGRLEKVSLNGYYSYPLL